LLELLSLLSVALDYNEYLFKVI